MPDDWLALVLDESKWLTIAMGTAFLAVVLTLAVQRGARIAAEARILGAMTLLFAVTISVMAFGHLLAVTVKLMQGTLVGSTPGFYAIGVALALPSWWLLAHTLTRFRQAANRTTLALNGGTALALLVLGLPNLPLALPGILNVAYQVNTRKRVGWAIAGATVVLTSALFVGSLVFWASGQTFEQFRGME